jgi:hypothetical protein
MSNLRSPLRPHRRPRRPGCCSGRPNLRPMSVEKRVMAFWHPSMAGRLLLLIVIFPPTTTTQSPIPSTSAAGPRAHSQLWHWHGTKICNLFFSQRFEFNLQQSIEAIEGKRVHCCCWSKKREIPEKWRRSWLDRERKNDGKTFSSCTTQPPKL